MAHDSPRIPLEGSQPRYVPGTQIARRRPNPDATTYATVVVRPSGDLAGVIGKTRLYSRIGDFRHTDYYARHAAALGARASDLEAIARYARRHELTVTAKRPAECMVMLRGPLSGFSHAFGVEFVEIEQCWAGAVTGRYRSHLGPVLLPSSLRGVVQGVIGLDRPRPFVAHSPQPQPVTGNDVAPVDAEDVARHYGLPSGTNGQGETIALIMLGGGIPHGDLEAYFARKERRTRRRWPRPSIVSVPLKGSRDRPVSARALRAIVQMLHENPGQTDQMQFWHSRWTLEAGVSLQLLATFAPGARLVVYFSTGTYRGQYAALSRAIHDRIYNPSIICCCWGADENTIPPAVCRLFDGLFRVAMLKGITICCSSGDDGGRNGANFPASSPHVLGVGGTFFEKWALTGQETPWMLSGGGFSEVFDAPTWQKRDVTKYRRDVTGRGVPDVASRANMSGGYDLIAGGEAMSMGGTSVAVPLWAGLIARINQRRGRMGFFAPMLYSDPGLRNALHEVPGETTVYDAYNPGWNPCTGLGTPDGRKLLAELSKPRR